MKILLTFAAAFAAFTSVSAASAAERSGGHYEWQNRPVYGPNKSNLPSRIPVWVKDAPTVTNCDCAMMHDKAKSTECMDQPDHSKG